MYDNAPSAVPTVFVALMLEPGQVDLFSELEAEVYDILADHPCRHRDRHCDVENVVLIDCDRMRIGLGFAHLHSGEALTLCVGAVPEAHLDKQEAREAALLLRDIAQCAEALFEVRESLWQVAVISLDTAGMLDHTRHLRNFNPDKPYQGGPVLIPIDAPVRETAHSPSTRDVMREIRSAVAHADQPSWAMKASVLAMSTAFVLVTPPVGMAMLTYTALRQGEGLKLLPSNIFSNDVDHFPENRATGT